MISVVFLLETKLGNKKDSTLDASFMVVSLIGMLIPSSPTLQCT